MADIESRPGMHEESGIVPGRNWMLRYLIQQEAIRTNPLSTQQTEGLIDPLAAVKRRYYQMYCEAIGQPGISPASSPVHASAANQIATLVDTAAFSAYSTYDRLRQQVEGIPQDLQDFTQQYLNEITSTLSHGSEDMLETTVRWLGKEDPLMFSRIGRVVRRLIPDQDSKAIAAIKSATQKQLDEVTARYRLESARIYKR